MSATTITISQPSAAQAPAACPERVRGTIDLGGAIVADGEEARYLRTLALIDTAVGLTPVLQPFPGQVEFHSRRAAMEGEHPWRARYRAETSSRGRTAFRCLVTGLRSSAEVILNTTGPIDEVAGPAWAGRGVTAVGQIGIQAQWGPLRLQLAPIAFYAQNLAVTMLPTGLSGDGTFRDPRFFTAIDLPQRFGDHAYGRIDAGESVLDVAAFGLTTGISNARQHWGPAQYFPLVLGSGSGGFPHLFIGTAGPRWTPVGDVQVRLLTGRLAQSRFSPVDSGETDRFLSGIIGAFRPRLLPSLELGATRIANGPWPAKGFSFDLLTRPIRSVINDNVGPINQNADNGFASVFARLAPAGGGLEAYAEMSREDFAGNQRWLVLEPDDLAQLTLGLARVTRVGNFVRTLRLELTDGEVSHTERAARTLLTPLAPYTHGSTIQGLTNRGQLLGNRATYGGSGAVIRWDQYAPTGRLAIAVERQKHLDWIATMGLIGGQSEGMVRYTLRTEWMVFRDGQELGVTVAPAMTLNDQLRPGVDVLSAELRLMWRGW